MKKFNITFLDGSIDEQIEAMDRFMESFTDEENERAMSDEFAYLDDDDEND